ncbi:SAM-dependent chlorinase/fluorinase [Bradyrhizobium sp. RDI18]|uniref:SAM-dependent chlorinase/fluorinase n=1 Tax=Bradyrhizobium sp. RDI18 TaxID=3367400 RepID=UPI0037217893
MDRLRQQVAVAPIAPWLGPAASEYCHEGSAPRLLWREGNPLSIPFPYTNQPVSNSKASAYLLAAYAWFPVRTVFLCVVDPGVGGTRRASIFLEAGGLRQLSRLPRRDITCVA